MNSEINYIMENKQLNKGTRVNITLITFLKRNVFERVRFRSLVRKRTVENAICSKTKTKRKVFS